jgi:predicted phosphodiesterase
VSPVELSTVRAARLGVLSDVHGDLASLQDALAQLDRLGVTEVVCAGDLLDWGPSPVRCIELLTERGIPCVRGNHDFLDAAGGPLPMPVVGWIVDLPLSWERTIAGVRVAVWHGRPGDLDLDVYGRRDDPETGPSPRRRGGLTFRGIRAEGTDVGELLDAADADVLVVGHTHVPMHLTSPAGAIVNPGSVLRSPPRALPASGTFGILELPACRFTVHRTADGEPGEVKGR